jgi:hypothetical protein
MAVMMKAATLLTAMLALAPLASAQEVPADYAGVLKTLNRPGD